MKTPSLEIVAEGTAASVSVCAVGVSRPWPAGRGSRTAGLETGERRGGRAPAHDQEAPLPQPHQGSAAVQVAFAFSSAPGREASPLAEEPFAVDLSKDVQQGARWGG